MIIGRSAMLVAIGCLASSCAWLLANTDERRGLRVTAYRAPVSAPGAQCAATCLGNFNRCQTGVAGADQCNNVTADCMNGCPGVTQSEAAAGTPLNHHSARATCDADLPEPKYCFVMDNAYTDQFGLVFQPDHSASAQVAPASAQMTPASTGAASAGTFKVGQAVLVRFQGGKFWFAGRVKATEGRAVAISYLDGSSEIVRAEHVRPFDWKVGTAVECEWKRKGAYFAGKIAAVKGQTGVHIAYADGDREDTDIALCRSR